MARDRTICGIDVGSFKVATVVAALGEDERVSIIGVSSVPSKGVKKGQVVDIEDAVRAITESVESAERMAGCSITSAYVAMGGPQIECVNQHAVVAVAQPEGEIRQSDVDRVNDGARAIALPPAREILHVIPRSYTVDGQAGVRDPIGMSGIRLETDTHIVTGATPAMRNLAKCVNLAEVDVAELVFTALASSEAVLSDTEKELGVVLIDIGGETTDVMMWVDGSVAHSAVIPIGGRHITQDIAVGLRISLESAENLKLKLGIVPKQVVTPGEERPAARRSDEILDLKAMGVHEEVGKVLRKTVTDTIMKPRLQEIFKYVGQEIKRSKFGTQVPSGLVITGGASLTYGLLDQAKYTLEFPARLGGASGFSGLTDEIESPAFATAAGLVLYALKSEGGSSEVNLPVLGKGLPIKAISGKVVNLIKSFLP